MRRGQATLFVILGLVIVAIVGTAYTFRAELLEATFGKEAEKSLAVPPQAEKVKAVVENCLDQVTQEGLGILGVQGGYISLPAPQIPASPIYPFTNTFDLFGDQGVAVPLWYFEDATGSEQVQVPTKKMMEDELAGYIETSLSACLNDFQALRTQGYALVAGAPTATVSLNEKTVVVNLDFPIDITLREFQFQLSKFKKSIATAFPELYEIAKQVVSHESKQYFLEDRVIDLMVVYDEIPFSGVDFACTPKTWTKTEVYTNLKQIIASNLQQLRIEGTDSVQGDEPKSFVIDALSKKHQARVDFRYDTSWPFLIEVLGENGEILRGKPFTAENELSAFLLPLFCLNDYHFVYNIKFPVVITIEKGNDILQFATLVIIQNNQPRKNREIIEPFDLETPICQYPTKDIKIVVEGYGKNGLVLPLNNAHVSFKCLNQVCDLGETRVEEQGVSLTKKVPSCFNGLFIAQKEGFHRSEAIVSTNNDVQEVTLALEPIKKLSVEVIVNDEGSERSAYPSELVLFTLINKEEKYTTSIMYPTQNTLQLVAGNYDITASIIVQQESGFTFPEKEIDVCNDVPQKGLMGIAGLTKKQCAKQKIDKVTLQQIPVGTATVQWFADRESLLNAEKIRLSAWRGKTPQSMEDLAQSYQKVEKKEVKAPVLE
jgi:hypothetical protein